jgi:hypothetical protein
MPTGTIWDQIPVIGYRLNMEWREAAPPPRTPGPIYNFRRGYEVAKAGRHENAEQFAALQSYLRLTGRRTLTALSEVTGYNETTLCGWSKRWQWEKRVAAFEKDQLAIAYREVDKRKRDAHKNAINEFRNSSERQARMMSRVSEDLIRLLGKRIEKAEENKEEIPLHMVSGLIRAAAGISEQARQSWGHALGVGELLEVVENEVERVRVEELQEESSDPYYFEVEE